MTNHRAHADDPLHALLRMKSFTLNIDEMFTGKTERSAMFQPRKLWMEAPGHRRSGTPRPGCGGAASHTPAILLTRRVIAWTWCAEPQG